MINEPAHKWSNKLIKEKSPYLLQHAHNPVDWFAWGEEAFARAKKEDKPVFLSIGYSTCHWCHVMARESFEDEEVARALNRDYISIKVDREERPDIDAVYMAVCQALTGSGGWPLTVLMTPEQKPFWAGTYLPKKAAYGQLGLLELLAAVSQQWDLEREKITEASEQITSFLNVQKASDGKLAQPQKTLLHTAVKEFTSTYDEKWGGFGAAPKFPTPHNLLFLLRYSLLEQDDFAQHMAEHTLQQMYRGGIFDHIGGGFSRYSTDAKWLVPHFEKMLYDNALLTLAYLEAYQITRAPFYSMVTERIIRYVLAELTDSQGGFYCGQDADSDGVEGKYYVFSAQEINQVLGKEDGAAFSDWFGVSEEGNFEGKNIPNLLHNPQYEQPSPQMMALCNRLYAYRKSRTHLHKDDKVLTSWNAIMIAALAKASWLLENCDYLHAAQKAQGFIENNLIDQNGRIKIRFHEGEAAHDGQLDDYAFYALALLELYHATLDAQYLQRTERIAQQMLDQFRDDAGGFLFYSKDGEQLISHPKETYDGAIPSGNSVAAIVLQQLFVLTGERKWQQESQCQISFLSSEIKKYPAGHSMALIALSKVLYPTQELVCATTEKEIPTRLKICLQKNKFPNLSVILKNHENEHTLEKVAPFTASYAIPEQGTLYYLCRNGACEQPIDNIEVLVEKLKNLA